ncbi:hypothetical protein KCP76_06080 [Salmonella enterica subsp. enterica serovar Weltevreden]|nr:hypothetical protein KCP76_06080 [Salmonella enterica subsp. enterica serovar Weltevreden]
MKHTIKLGAGGIFAKQSLSCRYSSSSAAGSIVATVAFVTANAGCYRRCCICCLRNDVASARGLSFSTSSGEPTASNDEQTQNAACRRSESGAASPGFQRW